MTGTHQATRAVSTGIGARPSEHLRIIHRGWLHDLREVLSKVALGDDTTWGRWGAIQYISTIFSARFDRERSAVEELAKVMEGNQASRLWGAAELITAVRWQLHHSVGLCQHPEEFSKVTIRLLKATELWFIEIEDFLNPLSWSELPNDARQAFESLSEETSYAG